ncbi:hypothetical protein JCM11641_008255 [Rhodosporidiobolus odoratus]
MSTPAADPAATSSSYVNTIPAATQVVPSVGLDGKPSSPTSSSASSDNGGDTFPTAAIVVIAIIGGIVFFFTAYKLYRWWLHRQADIVEHEDVYPETRGLQGAMSPAMGALSPPSQMSFAFNGESMARRSGSGFGLARSRQASWGADSWAGAGYYGEKGDATPSPPFAGTPIPPGSPTSREGSPGPNGSYHSLAAYPSQHSMPSSTTRGSLNAPSIPRRSFYPSSASASGPGLLNTRASSSYSTSQLPGSVHTFSSGTRLAGAPHNPRSRVEVVPPLPLAPPPGTVIATDKSTLDFAPSSGIGRGEQGASAQGEEWLNIVHSAAHDNAHGDAQERLNPAFDGAYPSAYSHQQHSFPPAPSSSGSSRSSSAPRAGPSVSQRISHSNVRQPPSTSALRSSANSSGSTFSSQRPLPPPIDTSARSSTESGSQEPEPRSPLERLQRRVEREARGLSFHQEELKDGSGVPR